MKRTFIQLSRAWYGEANLKTKELNYIDDFNLNIDGSDCVIEVWDLDISGISYSFTMFDDSWKVIPQIQDLFDAMSKYRGSLSVVGFRRLLLNLGFEDITPIEQDNNNE